MIEISILNLFGHFNYSFSMEKNHITILTGPNGYGKSTILRCIQAIGNSDLLFFFETIYDTIEIRVKSEEGKKELKIISNDDYVSFNDRIVRKRYIRYLSRGTAPYKTEYAKHEFYEDKDGYKEILGIMKDIFGDVFFISEHRIVYETEPRFSRFADGRRIEREWVESTEKIPEKLIKCMQEAEGNYSQKANELDSTFPERLFTQKNGISEKDFYENLDYMHECVQKLYNYGFTRMRELNEMKFHSEDARALKVYFDDFKNKYKEFEEILDRIELFQDIVNRRFRFKRIEISNTGGILVVDEVTRQRIGLSSLSSGEKEIITLFYNLLFENTDGGMLLVDEPETSLHIAWQRMFIDDLRKIAKLRKFTVLIATHSAQIINGNRNIQIDLGELYKNGLNQGK